MNGFDLKDMAEVIEFARQLNNLKKNFVAQRTLVLEIQCQLTKILQPRQHAILMLKVCYFLSFPFLKLMIQSGESIPCIRLAATCTNS